MGGLGFDVALLLEPDMMFRLGLQAVLFCLSFFFSGSETALFSLSPLDLRKLNNEGNPQAERLEGLLERPRRLIISLLCGNELVNIVATANMASILVTLFGPDDAALINLVVMFPLLLLFGEITPKTIAVSAPVRVSTTFVVRPLDIWVKLIKPVREPVRLIADYVTTALVGAEVSRENILSRDEFHTVIDRMQEDAVLSSTERAILNNLLDCTDTEVVEIMTPRTQIDFVNADRPLDWAIDKFMDKRHRRIPVWRRHRDNIIGVLHVDDVAELRLSDVSIEDISIEDLLRPAVVVPLTKTVHETFEFIRNEKSDFALVLNEYGGVEGMITIYDVLAYVFGDVSELRSSPDDYRVPGHRNSYDVPGDMKLVEFDDISNLGLSDPRMATVGGVAFRHFDRVPDVGEQVVVGGVTLTVLDVTEHRISRLRVSRSGVQAPERPAADRAGLEGEPS